MALSTLTVFEVRPGGADTNGGGFVDGASGTDYSQQDAAQFSGIDLAIDATTNTKVTSPTHNFVATDVGNIFQITAGTGFTIGFYQIVSVASNAATLDRSAGTLGSTGGTWAEGGALASVGKVGSAGNFAVYVYNAGSTVYSITSATNNVANGTLSTSRLFGYSTNRTATNTDSPPTLQLNVATATIFSASACIRNFILDGNNQTTSKAIGSNATAINCTIKNMTGANSVAGRAYNCVATANSGVVFSGQAYYCEAYANTATPFAASLVIQCLSYGNTGATTDGFTVGFNAGHFNCVSYGNARDGYRSNSSMFLMIDDIAEGNAGVGANHSAVGYTGGTMLRFAYYNNTGGTVTSLSGTSVPSDAITGSASFFVDAASSNFALNNNASAGALLRGTGFGVFLRGLSTSYRDIGPTQHQETVAAPELRIPSFPSI